MLAFVVLMAFHNAHAGEAGIIEGRVMSTAAEAV